VNTYGYTLQNPLWYLDPLGLNVQICSRPADLSFPLNQVDHWWVKTSTIEAGMGPMNGQVPAQEGRSDRPGDPVQTVDCGFRRSRATVPIHVGPAFRNMPAG
jgi:hypothetical protein